MTIMRACLFGRFNVACDDRAVVGIEARRVQELLAYLLLHRDRPQLRERLGDVLWGDTPAEQVRKGLRQTLWKLQSTLHETVAPILRVEGDYVALDDRAQLWLDVAAFEDAYRAVNGLPGSSLPPAAAETLVDAVALYRGNLLEGWYNDWCLEERERLFGMCLAMLNKLTAYYTVHEQFDAGLEYGRRALHFDRAHERTHRHLMRLHYLSGDRSGALRQYHRCVEILREDLGVVPSKRTVALYELVCRDGEYLPAAPSPTPTAVADLESLACVVTRLVELRDGLTAVERQLSDYLDKLRT